MSNIFSDPLSSRATRRRLAEELVELDAALASGRNGDVLDELVDVKYYIDKLAACHAISNDCLTRYAAVKTALREAGVRCKTLELRLAAEFAVESQLNIERGLP